MKKKCMHFVGLRYKICIILHGVENVKLTRILNDKSATLREEWVVTLKALTLYLGVGSEEKGVIIIMALKIDIINCFVAEEN
jgi:hypothetical protein